MTRLFYIKFIIAFSVLNCLGVSQSFGQNFKKKGDKAWEEGRYKTAVNNYGQVKKLKQDKKLLAKRGLGFLKLNQLNKAIEHFTLAKKLGHDDPELFLWMAQAKHHLNAYEEAAFFYKSYVKEVGEKSSEAQLAMREMKNCAYSAFNIKNKPTGFVQPFGDEVNTYYDEVYPMQSPRFGNIYYFTSNRNLKDMEVYSYELDAKGEWQKREEFGSAINTAANEYVMDISPDGQSLLYVTATGAEHNNKIYVSTFDEAAKQHIIELPDYLIDGAMDLQIIDYNSIAFASKELGGFGGYDIFKINYKNGIWSDPINAGEKINSVYDERSPYYATTGDYLYYSSNRPYCYGGFDIYYFNTLSVKGEAVNMGLPINSAGDDLQFRLNEDGQMALMSSDRKTGEGAFDIFMVYMNDPKPMPAKDTRQLAYVRDYFNKLNPDKVMAEVEEPSKSHLEKLKDRLDLEEGQTDPSEESIQDEVVNTENTDDRQEENETIAETDPSEIISATATETTTEIVIQDNRTTDHIEPTATEKKQEPVVAVTEDASPTKTIDQETTSSALPQKESGESPLASMQSQSEELSTLPKIKTIAGEKISNALLYSDRHDLMNAVNKPKVNNIIRYLKTNSDHVVHIIAHTDHLEPGLPEFMQYNTLKRAMLIGRFLMEAGISKDRISIESVSSNYPLVKPELAGKPNVDYLAYNKRIDFEIRDAGAQLLMSHNISTAKIPGYAMDRKYELYTQIKDEVYYSVEIGNHSHIFKNAVLRLYSDIYIRKPSPVANNRYYIGLYTNYEAALELQKELADSSAPYAKVVAFFQGMPIKKNEMKSLAKDYPDLSKFLAGQGE